MRCTPLEIFAAVVLPHGQLHNAARSVVNSYDQFVGLLNDEEVREHLDRLAPPDAELDAHYQAARGIGHAFQEGLNEIFLTENGTELFALTKKYGVF
jgi:hypothetical protein